MYKMPSKKAALKDIKAVSLDSPRVRFNWGFHDAAQETKLGIRRSLVDGSKQTTSTVAWGFDKWYYCGYQFGIR